MIINRKKINRPFFLLFFTLTGFLLTAGSSHAANRLYDLRHWSATQSIAAGQDVRTVAHRLGHADPAMTLRVYAHAVERADEALAQILGSTLDG